MIPVKPATPPKRYIRARGKARRAELLVAASTLLADHEVEEITFKDIYEFAGIPPGSAYHFFDNIESIQVALFDQFADELFEYMLGHLNPLKRSDWMELLDNLVSNVAIFYNNNPAARRIIMHSRMPIGVISEADKMAGMKTEQLLNQYFVLPEFKNRLQIFILSTKIVHLFLSISVIHHGMITAELIDEAKTAFTGYLKMYLPEKLERRMPEATGR